jgi:anaerobic selenocysteine-containing dehydrogenase
VATLIDEIITPGEGQVRALLTVAGNPVISTPDGARLDAAIAALDLVVAIDPYVTATSRHADVILPPPGALHRSHYDLAFTGLAVRNIANYSPPVLEQHDGPDEWEILLTLAAIALGQAPPIDVDAADAFVARTLVETLVGDPTARLATRDADAVMAALGDRRGPDRLLDLLLRTGPYGEGFGTDPAGLSLEQLEAHPHGIDLGPLEPRIPDVLATASGRIELAAPLVLDELVQLEAELATAPDGLVLIGRRHLRTNNSWSHNVAGLAKGQQLCTLQVHPQDADACGVIDGGTARVRSRAGEVTATVEVTDDLRPGVVSLPHGFGHDLDGVELTVARQQGGTNANVLTDRDDIDPLSGTAVLNGIPVEVAPA